MRVFVHSTLNHKESLKQSYRRIVELLQEAGVTVISNHDEEGRADITKTEIERMSDSGENLIDKMDGIIIEASISDAEIGYLLAYAIAQKKPVLYVYQRNSGAKKVISYFTGIKVPETVFMKSYELDDLRDIILQFLERIETGENQDIPSIKFTLRITPQIERYLTRKAKQTKTSKADFLREKIIKKYMEGEINK